jgi:hypothetical protein
VFNGTGYMPEAGTAIDARLATARVPAVDSGIYPVLTAGDRVVTRQDRPEDASLAALAGDADTAALGFDDPPGQRQAETGPLMPFAGRGIELTEFAEEFA